MELTQIQELLTKSDSFSIELSSGRTYQITSSMLNILHTTEQIHIQEYIPSVIEPSFGIDRIMYCLLENTIWIREEDSQRFVIR